jgi:HAD superfamily hydrolase (TIGR01509 family)
MLHRGKVEAVLFDMDGVIIESEPLWSEAERQLLARRNLLYSARLKTLLMGLNSSEAVGRLKEHYRLRESVNDLINERNQIVIELFRRHLRPAPQVLELIRCLRESGIKTALASSSPRVVVDEVLDKLGIVELFDLVINGDQVIRGKPAPDIYLAAAGGLAVSPGNCLVIEDAPNGVKAAKAAGMGCLAITTSVAASELAGADHLVRDFTEVHRLILETEGGS